MQEIKQKEPFLLLPEIGLSKSSEDFSLYLPLYEKVIAERTGIDINAETFKLNARALEKLYQLVPNFVLSDADRTNETIDEVISRYPEINAPASMLLTNMQELEQSVLMLYQVSFAHYILFKSQEVFNSKIYQRTERGPFPKDFCGPSTRNLFVSLLEHGFLNAGYAINMQHDYHHHNYLILPFVLEEKRGAIVLDPTSDQLWSFWYDYPIYKPRNAIFVVYGEQWEYKAPFKYGKEVDLFPEIVFHLSDMKALRNALLDEIGKGSRHNLDFALTGKEFLNKAFQNPVDIKPYLKS